MATPPTDWRTRMHERIAANDAKGNSHQTGKMEDAGVKDKGRKLTKKADKE